jgi:hypothetical protein
MDLKTTLAFRLIVLFLSTVGIASGQPDAILLQNPSFEDKMGMGKAPMGWYYCGSPDYTPPDIHHSSSPGAIFGVEAPAADGLSYVGMVARDDNTVEGIGQRLSAPLLAGQCYALTFDLARSAILNSASPSTLSPASFTEPVRLEIWAGFENCEKMERLGMSPVIEHTEWEKHTIILTPKQSYTQLVLQAAYLIDGRPYNGNLLIDNLSALLAVDCASPNEVIAAPEAIDIPSITNIEALKRFLVQEGQQIRFVNGEYLLEQHLFVDETQQIRQGNKHIWAMAQAMKQFPDIQLKWILTTKAGEKRDYQALHLYYSLIQAQLAEGQFAIENSSKRKANRENDQKLSIGKSLYVKLQRNK